MKIEKWKINKKTEGALFYIACVLLVNDGLCNAFPWLRLCAGMVVLYGLFSILPKKAFYIGSGLTVAILAFSLLSSWTENGDLDGNLYIMWMMDMNTKDASLHNSVYSYITLFLVSLLAYWLSVFFVYQYGKEDGNELVLKAAKGFRLGVGVLFALYMIWLFISGMSIHKAAMITVCLLCYMIFLNEGEQYRQFSLLSRFFIPTGAALFLCFLKTGDTFTEIQRWEPYHKIQSVVSEIMPGRHGLYFGFTGYSQDAVLKDSINATYTEALVVSAEDKKDLGNIYLTGSIWDRYENGSWKMSEEEEQTFEGYTEKELELFQFYFVCYANYPEILPLFTQRNLEITYKDVITKTVFYPWLTETIQTNEKWEEKGSGRSFQKIQGEKTNYQVVYDEINSRILDGYLVSGMEYEYEDDAFVIRNLAERGLVQLKTDVQTLLDALAEYRTYVQEKYMQLPDEYSQTLVDYAKSLTDTAYTPYLKAIALEKSFEEYYYNTHPEVSPREKDFLEKFILENKNGFCTYYATALTLMCRSVGIPARYVQGFLVEGEGRQQVTVEDAASHAWTEIYLDDIGWIPLEATPGYQNYRYPDFTPGENSDSVYYVMNSNQNQEHTTKGTNNHVQEVQPTKKTEKHTTTTVKPQQKTTKKIAVILTIAGAGILLVVIIIIFRKKAKTPEENEQLKEIDKMLLKLKRKGYIKMQQETFREFMERCSNDWEMEDRKAFLEIAVFYEKIRYGKKALSLEEVNALKQAIQILQL